MTAMRRAVLELGEAIQEVGTKPPPTFEPMERLRSIFRVPRENPPPPPPDQDKQSR